MALEGATGATYPGVVFREVREAGSPARMSIRALWRHANGKPSLPPFLNLLRDRYPDLSAALAQTWVSERFGLRNTRL